MSLPAEASRGGARGRGRDGQGLLHFVVRAAPAKDGNRPVSVEGRADVREAIGHRRRNDRSVILAWRKGRRRVLTRGVASPTPAAEHADHGTMRDKLDAASS